MVMDAPQLFSQLLNPMLSLLSPALPDIATLREARYVSWAICLAFLVLFLGRKLPRLYPPSAAAVVLVWTLLPGPVSPAFWLGLAFQMPSPVSTMLCLMGCVRLLRSTPPSWWAPDTCHALRCVSGLAVVLGWVLLLDTFALLPISASVYALGFSPLAVMIAAVMASLPWVLGGVRAPSRFVSYLLWAVLLTFVVLRLPTGNLWDVLLDPWLWIVLQIDLIALAVRWFKAKWRGSKATRV